MADFWSLVVGAFLIALFSILAFRSAKTICLHALMFCATFICMPLATAWLAQDRNLQRAYIGNNLAGQSVADAVAAHAHLFILYALGLLTIALLFGDRAILRNLQTTLAAQKFRPQWLLLFVVFLGTTIAIKAAFSIMISGTTTLERLQEMPYIYSCALSVLDLLTLGIYCYLCLFSSRSKIILAVCLFYAAYVLVADGRRELILSLAALAVLRSAAVGFKFNWRLPVIAAGLVAVFVLVGPIFLKARIYGQALQDRGVSATDALMQATTRALDEVTSQGDGLTLVSDNVVDRGNAGTFFLTVASQLRAFQHGELTWVSFLWAVPSAFVEKPPLQAEAMIELAADLPLTDSANSTQLVFYADYGPLGMYLCAVYVALTLYLVAKLLGSGRQYGLFQLSLLGIFMVHSLTIEDELTHHFVDFRNLALIGLFVLLRGFVTSAGRGRGFTMRGPAPAIWPSRAHGHPVTRPPVRAWQPTRMAPSSSE